MKKKETSLLKKLLDIFKPQSIEESLHVEYENYSCYISATVLDRQNAWKNLKKIKKLHVEKFKIFSEMEKSNNKKQLIKLSKQVRDIEFKLQKEWGFEEDENKHRWFDVPKCKCPKLDNEDNFGTEFRNIDLDCPIHGKPTRKKK